MAVESLLNFTMIIQDEDVLVHGSKRRLRIHHSEKRLIEQKANTHYLEDYDLHLMFACCKPHVAMSMMAEGSRSFFPR